MKNNVGSLDRVVRIIMGLGLLSLIFLVNSSLRWIGLIGLVPLMTAVMGSCPLYTLFGLNSCPLSKQH
jgi:hypothetical protein